MAKRFQSVFVTIFFFHENYGNRATDNTLRNIIVAVWTHIRTSIVHKFKAEQYKNEKNKTSQRGKERNWSRKKEAE